MQLCNNWHYQLKSKPIVNGIGLGVIEHAYLPSLRRDALTSCDEMGTKMSFPNLIGATSRHWLKGADPG